MNIEKRKWHQSTWPRCGHQNWKNNIRRKYSASITHAQFSHDWIITCCNVEKGLIFKSFQSFLCFGCNSVVLLVIEFNLTSRYPETNNQFWNIDTLYKSCASGSLSIEALLREENSKVSCKVQSVLTSTEDSLFLIDIFWSIPHLRAPGYFEDPMFCFLPPCCTAMEK